MKTINVIVVTFLCLAVSLGSWGCTPLSFDSSADPLENPDVEDSGFAAEADEIDTLQETGSETAESDTAVQPDVPGPDTRFEDTIVDTVVIDTAKPDTTSVTDTASPGYDHKTAMGDSYTSSLPKGVYSAALFAESIDQIQRKHTGLWSGPYDATCNLSSEGHGVSEKCQMIWKSDVGVMLCPYGISYVAPSASCPPLASPVSWW